MPLYLKPDIGIVGRQVDLERDYKPDAWEAFVTGFEEGFESGPFKSGLRAMSREHFSRFPEMTDQEAYDYANEWAAEELPGLAMEEQEKRIAEAGLTGKMKGDPVWDANTLDLMIKARKEKEERDFIIGKAGPGGYAAAIGGEFLGAAADPFNLAITMVPVVGQARMGAMLGKAGGAFGRALTRAKIGALDGIAGSVPMEAITLGGSHLAQQDYTPMQSLMNIAGGALFGAALRPAAGLVSEFRSRHDILKPWEIEASSDFSRARMAEHARAIAEARIVADPQINVKQAQAEGYANAAAYDLFVRNRAHREKRSIEDVYNEWRLDYESGSVRRIGTGEKAGQQAQATGLQTGELEFYDQQKAVIRFFAGSKRDDGQLALVKIFRKQLQEAGEKADASPEARKIWAEVQEELGINPGDAWTDDLDHAFAEKMLRAFWQGEARGRLAPAFNAFADELAGLAEEVEKSGFAISGDVAKAFDSIWQQDLKANEQAFKKALGELLTREEEDFLYLQDQASLFAARKTQNSGQPSGQPAQNSGQLPGQTAEKPGQLPGQTAENAGQVPVEQSNHLQKTGEAPLDNQPAMPQKGQDRLEEFDVLYKKALDNPESISKDELANMEKLLSKAEDEQLKSVDDLEREGLDAETAEDIRDTFAAEKIEDDKESFMCDTLVDLAACHLGL